MEELLEETAESTDDGQDDHTPESISDQEEVLEPVITKQERAKAPRFRPFPKPPRARGRGGTISPDQFFEYWRQLPPTCMERCSVYVYREYPKMNYMLSLSLEDQELVAKKKKQPPSKNIALFIEPFESKDWREEMLRRFGEGDYKLWLNDSGIKADPKARNQNVIKTFITLRDDEHPPVIPDIRCVDPDDPINKSYLEKLRVAGLLNSPVQESSEEEDMAASGEVVKDLTRTVIELSKDRAERADRTPPPAQTPQPSTTDQANVEAIRVMGKAFETIEQQRSKLTDPDAAVDRVVKLAQMLQPQSTGNGDAIVTLLSKQLELSESRHKSELELMERRHEREVKMMQDHQTALLQGIEERIKLVQVSATPTVGPTVTPNSEFAVLEKLINMKEKLDGLTGGGEQSSIPGWVPYGLQGLKILGDVAMNVMHNLAVAKSGQGAALPPAQTSAEVGDTEEAQADGEYAAYARQIHAPLKEALSKQMTGYEFAARLILQMGGNTQAYDFVCADGVPGLMRFLQSAPEVWGTMQQFSAGGQHERFMSEFCNRDLVMKALDILRTPKVQPKARVVVTDTGPVKTAGPIINVPGKEN